MMVSNFSNSFNGDIKIYQGILNAINYLETKNWNFSELNTLDEARKLIGVCRAKKYIAAGTGGVESLGANRIESAAHYRK